MNENIDLTKILNDCPIGWMLYSSVHGYVAFQGIENGSDCPITFFYIDEDKSERCYSVTEQGLYEPYCDGECTLFPSKDQRDWSKFTAPWYKKEKFDPKTLQPFDKVLARMSRHSIWTADLVSFISCTYFKCVGGYFENCIPYNEDTKHLVGTSEEAPEYYRYWED